MTFEPQRERQPLQRRASTPLPASCPAPRHHPPLGHSVSDHQGGRSFHLRERWSSESDDDSHRDPDSAHRVLLLGDRGVGKSSLAGIFAGFLEREEPSGDDSYERILTVDGEETKLIVMDTWEQDTTEEEGGVMEDSMHVASAYIIVYSVTDRCSFNCAAELRIQLRRARQADNVPIILVGNKSDLVRCREVTLEEGRACAVVFDCKFIETSASLQHNVSELFDGVVRQLRLRRHERCRLRRRSEGFTRRARRFLDRLVTRSNQKRALKARSKSCHDLSVP